MIPKRLKILRSGIMLVVSSPSGAGKTSLVRKLTELDTNIAMSVSYTTRLPRDTEKDSSDYYFVTDAKFDNMVKNGDFLEYAEVFGNKYGTPKKPVMDNINKGIDVVFDIDWQGTQTLRQIENKNIVSIFVLPPSTKELEKRLRKRGQDSEEEVLKRMEEAESDITHWAEYDYIIVNYDIEESLSDIKSILVAERLKRERQVGLSNFIRNIIINSSF